MATVLSAGSVRLTRTVKLDCVLGTLVWSTVRVRLQDAVDGVGVGVGVGVDVGLGVGVGVGVGVAVRVGVGVGLGVGVAVGVGVALGVGVAVGVGVGVGVGVVIGRIEGSGTAIFSASAQRKLVKATAIVEKHAKKRRIGLGGVEKSQCIIPLS